MAEPLVPNIRIEIEGRPLPDDVINDVGEVVFESELHEMDSMTLKVSSPSTGDLRPEYQGLFFGIRKTAVLYAGYGSDAPKFIGAAMIETLEPQYADQVLTVHGLDGGYLLTKKPTRVQSGGALGASLGRLFATLEARTGEDQDTETEVEPQGSVLDMINKIANEYGFLKDVVDPATAAALVGGSMELGVVRENTHSRYEYLETEAAKLGFDFYVRYSLSNRKWVLHFHPPRSDQAQTLEFKFNAGDEQSTVMSFRADFTDRDVEEERGLLKVITPNLQPTEHTAPLIAEVVEVITSTSFNNAEAAQKFADSVAERRNKSHLNADCTVIGTPALQSGDVHRISGLRSKYVRDLSGLYRFLSVKHRISNREGYECSCKVVRISE